MKCLRGASMTGFMVCSLTSGRDATSLIQSLPEDASVADCLEEFEVGNMEPGSSSSTKELGLRTKSDASGLGSGAILGVYRGFMCSTLNFNQRWKCEPYTHWQPRLLSEFAYRMNVYAADFSRPADCSQGLMRDVWQNILPVQPIQPVCCGSGHDTDQALSCQCKGAGLLKSL